MLDLLRKIIATKPSTESLTKILEKAEAERITVPKIIETSCGTSCNGCTGSPNCAKACPTGVFQFENKTGTERTLVIRGEKCIRCNRCIEQCPNHALTYGFRLPVASRSPDAFRQRYVWQNSSFLADQTSKVDDGRLPSPKTAQNIFGRSLQFREVDAGSCNACEVEVNMLTSPHYDVERFGIGATASPRFADALLVTGPVTRNLREAAQRTYNATPTPKVVIAMGTCAISGGIYEGSYSTTDGASDTMPVDVYIPGCPPSPPALIYGFLLAMNRIDKG